MIRSARAGLAMLLALGAMGVSRAEAQGVSVRVRVVDVSGTPLVATSVSIVSNGKQVAAGRTDTLGMVALRTTETNETVELVVQRLGYMATRRLLPTRTTPITIEISLAAVPAALDTIRVANRGVQAGAQPVIRADEIASTSRGVFDFFDVLEKLRPELLDRIGRDIRFKCVPGGPVAGSLRIYINEHVVPREFSAVLRQVKSEAIAELRYVTCFDKSLAADDYPAIGHIYVTLLKTYAFDLKRGTYLRDTVRQIARASVDTTPLRPDHARLIGVYDEVSGSPIEGAEVINLLNGYSSRTTRTGTLALAFVDSIGALIRIERVGYAPLVMPITNRATDPPLTLTLTPRGSAEPRLARRLDPADSVRKLVVAGFYERRDTLPTATDARLGNDRVGSLARVSDAASVLKRPLCLRNLFIDGARVAASNGVDAVLSPRMVAGLEMYENTEIPLEFAPADSVRPPCATLIWTR